MTNQQTEEMLPKPNPDSVLGKLQNDPEYKKLLAEERAALDAELESDQPIKPTWDWSKEFDKHWSDVTHTPQSEFEAFVQISEDIKTFIRTLIASERQAAKVETAEEIIKELESNPNEDGSASPNIQHWIERKKGQLRKKFLINSNRPR